MGIIESHIECYMQSAKIDSDETISTKTDGAKTFNSNLNKFNMDDIKTKLKSEPKSDEPLPIKRFIFETSSFYYKP